MRVVDTRDFCIPSDENDYDELVAFADTMANIPQFDAVPIEMLDKIRAEIEEYKSRQLTLAIGVDDLEKGKQIALEYVLAIIDKYRESEGD